MGIKEDAGILLAKLYEEYVTQNNTEINSKCIIKLLNNWDSGKINRAIDYLKDLDCLDISFFLGNIDGVYNVEITKLTPIGIEKIESKPSFLKTFGIAHSIPSIVSANWQAVSN